MKKPPIKVFYIAFFVCNFLISFFLLRGYFNPNISSYNDFGMIFLSSLGDLGVISLVFFLTLLICKKDKTRVLTLLIASLFFTIFIVFLQGFSNMFYTLFSYTQLTSFKNPSQGKLIVGYVSYFLKMFMRFHVLFSIIIYMFLLIISFFVNKEETHQRKVNKNLYGSGFSLVAMIIPMIICSFTITDSANSLSMNAIYGCSYMGTYNYYIYSIKDLLKKDISLDSNKESTISTYLNTKLYTKSNTQYTNVAENKNLIILQLEAINNFVINLEINNELIAPNLSKLANENYYSSRFYSAAGMGNTSDCEFSSIIGLYPNGNDLSIFELDGTSYPSIAKEFSKQGYKTFSVHGNEGGFYNRNNQHLSLFGFDEHIDKEKLLKRNNELSLIKDWISDDSLLQECVNIYKEQETNFFSYNILVSSHAPFAISDGVTEYQNNNLTNLANNYISYVKYVDTAIGNFITSLKENNLYDDSIIIMYGDHTSSLLINDVESITNKNYNDIEFRLEMQNVPFIMLGSDILNTNDCRVHSNIDIFPTIANLFNLNPTYKFGADMLSDDTSYVYNPRSLDLIFDDYTILTASNTIYYTNKNANKISKKEIKEKITEFNNYKYLNDLLVSSDYFK